MTACRSRFPFVLVSTAILSVFGHARAQEAGPGSSAQDLGRVSVTGSYLRDLNYSATAARSDLSAERLSRLGMTDIADLGRLEPALAASTMNNSSNSAGSIGASRVSLYGLPTLVLLNGRRQVGTGSSSANIDINALVPSIALRNVEVLKAGASSLYGSDAIGGVVNFLTRQNFSGLELNVDYNRTTSANHYNGTVGVLGGFQLGGVHVTAAASYFDRNQLNGTDREFSRQSPNFAVGHPGTYLAPSVSGSRTYADPTCGTIPTSVLVTSGTSTSCAVENAPYQGLIAATRRAQVYLNGTLALGDNARGFVELAYANVESNLRAPASLPKTTTSRAITIARTNPYNPFADSIAGNLVYLGFPILQYGPDRGLRADNETSRAVVGADGEWSGWNWQTSATFSRSVYGRQRPESSRTRLQAAINSGAYNPFGSAYFAEPGSAAYNSAEDYALFSVDATLKATQQQAVVDAVVSRELFQLPAGPVELAAGVQGKEDRFVKELDALTLAGDLLFTAADNDANIRRKAAAVFTELGVPVVKDVTLQLALRHERMSGGARTTDPKVGVLWKLNEGFSLRGTYASAFRAPELVQFGGSTTASAVVDDPNTTNVERINLAPQIVGNSNLKPETSKSYQFGALVNPLPSLRLSLDYFAHDYRDRITSERAQDVINADPSGSRVIRNAAGTIVGIAPLTYYNTGKVDLRGLDASASWRGGLGPLGRLDLSLAGTFITHYTETAAPGQASTSFYGSPKVSVLGSGTWSTGPHAVTLTARYYSAYSETDTQKFGSQTMIDAQYQADLGKLLTSRMTLTVGVRNLTDRLPAYNALVAEGYDYTSPSDPRGRMVYAAVKAAF